MGDDLLRLQRRSTRKVFHSLSATQRQCIVLTVPIKNEYSFFQKRADAPSWQPDSVRCAKAMCASEVRFKISHHWHPFSQNTKPHYKSDFEWCLTCLTILLFFFFFFENLFFLDHSTCTNTLMIKDQTTDEVCYFISLRNVELLCLQDMIKAEAYQRPITVSSANSEQRSKTGLHYMTATRIENNWISLLVWAHSLMALCIKPSIIIARMVLVSVEVLWPISRITEAGRRFLFFLF